MIIDIHVHIGSASGFNLYEEDVLYSMETYNIDYAIISSIEAVEYFPDLTELPPEMQKPQLESLKDCIEIAKRNPSKLGVAFWFKPHTERLTQEIRDTIKANIDVIKALKLHPYYSKTATDSPEVEEYLRFAEELNLPIIIHTGGCNEAEPITVYNAAKKFPKVNFIMAHMGLGSDNSEAINLISSLPNLYGDTAWVPIKSSISLIKKASSEKLFFGSDSPIDGKDTYLHNRTGDRSLYQEYFNELRELISEQDYNNIMYKNAIRMFNLPFNNI